MKVKLFWSASLPKRAHTDDAGADFLAQEYWVLQPHTGHVFQLDIAVKIPIGFFGFMASKSGLMVNHGVICLGGIIDSGFRGPIKVRMYNTSDEPYTIHRGDKLVQMIIIPCLLVRFVKAERLSRSIFGRNESGWGSTGR